VLEALPALLEQGGQLALLGAGDAVLQQAFLAAAADYPEQVGVQIGYHEAFSHRIIGGADVIMVPSRFEPCGLTQLYGLKYGTLPLVRRTGGLADTVVDCALENLADGSASGFVFDDCDATALGNAIRRAMVLWSRPKHWRPRPAPRHERGFWLAGRGKGIFVALFPSYLTLPLCWLHSLTRITYQCKLIGISFFAALMQRQLFWVYQHLL
jgi:glycogen synthase